MGPQRKDLRGVGLGLKSMVFRPAFDLPLERPAESTGGWLAKEERRHEKKSGILMQIKAFSCKGI